MIRTADEACVSLKENEIEFDPCTGATAQEQPKKSANLAHELPASNAPPMSKITATAIEMAR